MKLLTVKECAKILNVSLGLAYRIVSNGELPSVKIASAIRVKENDLEAYVEGNRNEPPQADKAKHIKRSFV